MAQFMAEIIVISRLANRQATIKPTRCALYNNDSRLINRLETLCSYRDTFAGKWWLRVWIGQTQIRSHSSEKSPI